MSDSKIYTCCICHKEFTGYGNDPWPVNTGDNRCCDECNLHTVIPERIRLYQGDSSDGDA